MEYGSHVWCDSTHTVLLNRIESKVFRLINSPPLTYCFDALSNQRNVTYYLFATAMYMLTALLNLLTACLPHSRGIAAQVFLLLIPIFFIFLIHELTSILTLSSLTLVNSGTLFLCLFFHLSMTYSFKKGVSKHL